MKKNTVRSDAGFGIRRRAEELLKKKAAVKPPLKEVDMLRLIHELQVHQIELELQNEELSRAREELELSRNQYAELYDFAPVGYFTFDSKGLILKVNLAGAQLLGVERLLIVNKTFTSFIADAYGKEMFSKHCEDVLQKEDKHICEIRLKRKDGSISYVQLQSIVKKDIENKAVVIFTAVNDINERKQAEELIIKNLEDLKHLNKDLERFNNASVGRELRMIELKKEINELCARAGQPMRYTIDFEESQIT